MIVSNFLIRISVLSTEGVKASCNILLTTVFCLDVNESYFKFAIS